MVTIHRATAAHLPEATRLFEGYLAFYERSAPSGAAGAFLARRLEEGNSVTFLAYEDDEAVGFAQVYPTFSSLSLTKAWVLNDLFVAPSARGTGAGRALLRAVVAEASEAGAAYVALETAYDNVRAQGLYESEGFEPEAGFRHYARSTGA